MEATFHPIIIAGISYELFPWLIHPCAVTGIFKDNQKNANSDYVYPANDFCPLALSDAPAIQRHFNNWNIVKHLAAVVPWPYPDDGAETFIRRELEKNARGEEIFNWVLVLQDGDGQAIGNINFRPRVQGTKGNRGFWLAEPYWNRGLMTEAVATVNAFAFQKLQLESFFVCNVASNVASRRVKQKTGAEFVGYIELKHHNGQSISEKWIVRRVDWLQLNPKPHG
jgi:[ribosomal protein S5]-alanine N-acetyltransferase